MIILNDAVLAKLAEAFSQLNMEPINPKVFDALLPFIKAIDKIKSGDLIE